MRRIVRTEPQQMPRQTRSFTAFAPARSYMKSSSRKEVYAMAVLTLVTFIFMLLVAITTGGSMDYDGKTSNAIVSGNVRRTLSSSEPSHDVAEHDLLGTHAVTPLQAFDREFYTVRINTWKRLEQLQVTLEHYETCNGVAKVQVVWCDAQGKPPSWLVDYDADNSSKVVLEHHEDNSLNERFRVIDEPPTLGIFSVDDDILRPCIALDSGFYKWVANPDRLVGFDARTHVVTTSQDGNEEKETWKYGYMSTTEKSNRYSMTLTRAVFVHVDYLKSYMLELPANIRERVATNFNCEDIAMSLWVSYWTDGKPPLLADCWAIKSMVKLYSKAAISGTSDHKSLRDACVNDFADTLGMKGKLKLAELYHHHGLTNPIDGFLECGEHAPVYTLGERYTDIQSMVLQWKKEGFAKLKHDISKLQNIASRTAYTRGLIDKTGPWKKLHGKTKA